jgi:hypothetical protein
VVNVDRNTQQILLISIVCFVVPFCLALLGFRKERVRPTLRGRALLLTGGGLFASGLALCIMMPYFKDQSCSMALIAAPGLFAGLVALGLGLAWIIRT